MSFHNSIRINIECYLLSLTIRKAREHDRVIPNVFFLSDDILDLSPTMRGFCKAQK